MFRLVKKNMFNLEKCVQSRKICPIKENMFNLEKYVQSRKISSI